MQAKYKILTIIVLGITFVSTGFGVLYLSPGLHPDPRLPNADKLEPNYNTGKQESNPSPTDIPSANNKFAMNFYSQISENTSENIFFSPVSIFTAFAVTYEGAQGDTASEIQQMFGFQTDAQKRKINFQSMLKEFQNTGFMDMGTPEHELQMANALWVADHFEPKQDYIDTAKTYYDSRVDKVDFVSNAGVETINNWVREQTQDKIDRLLEDDSTDELTAFVITNAIYFKGEWVHKFTPEFTRQADFHISEKETVKVQMMDLDKPILNYAENDLLQIIQLPYKGDRVSMLVLLPKEVDGIQSLEENLNLENLSDWKDSLEENMVGVYLPKFTSNTEYDLKGNLQQMGMQIPFASNMADFGGITEKQIYIDKAVHKAFVRVDEAGTEAAAATGITGRLQSGPPNTFRADHPFIFIIQDDSDGNILFMGKVVDPSQ